MARPRKVVEATPATFRRDVRNIQRTLRRSAYTIENFANTPTIREIANRTLVYPMKSAAPRKTGALRRSIGLKKMNNKLYVKAGKTKKVFYAHFVEWGTKASRKRPWSTRKRPFFFGTLNMMAPAFYRDAGEAIGEKFSATLNVKVGSGKLAGISGTKAHRLVTKVI